MRCATWWQPAHLHAGRWRHLYGAEPLVGAAREASRPGDPMSIDYRLSIHGLAEYRQGHLEDAAMRLEQAMAIARRTGRDPQGGVLAALPAPTLAPLRYEQDRVAEAGAAVDSLAAMALPGAGRPALECRDFAQVASIARGRPSLAVENLLKACDHAAASGRRLDEIVLRTSMALAHLALGELVMARQCFLHACREALSLGALRSIVDQPLPLQPLLQPWPAWRRDIAPDATLDARVQRLHESANAGGARRGASSLIETLSPRELHILKLVADGQSNKEIARGRGIAPEPVKTHVSKVFGKLGASNRAQAAAMVATG